MVNPN